MPLIATALSSLNSGVWESLLHDSTSRKLLMQRIREESRGLGVVGHIPIPAYIWERYVPDSFASVASRHFSGVGPPSDEAVVMLHALRSQNLLFPLPPGLAGPNGGVFAIPKTLDKCSLIVNLVPVNREMAEKPEKFSLPSVEVLALLAQVAQQGSSFFLPPLYSRARCLRPVWEVLGLLGGGGERNCVCAILTSVIVFGRCASRKPSAGPSVSRMVREEFCRSDACLLVGSIAPLCAKKVLERLVEETGLVEVLVLIYIEDVLIVGRGKGRVRGQAMRAVQALRAAGGVIKSTLEPVARPVWLGKDVDFGGGSLRTAGNEWEALLAHRLRLSVSVCSVRRLQQFLGRAQWICRPRFWHSPHSHVSPPPPSAVYPGQVVALYVRGLCVGFAGSVSGPPAERGA